MSAFENKTVVSFLAAAAVAATPAWTHEIDDMSLPPEPRSAQVDITNGLADQSALYAMQHAPQAMPANGVYQGRVNAYQMGQQFQPYQMQPVPAPHLQNPMYGQAQFAQQTGAFAAVAAAQSVGGYGPFHAYGAPSGVQPYVTPAAGGPPQMLGGAPAASSPDSPDTAMRQMGMVLGTAAVMQFLNNGGVGGMFNGLKSRGWSPRFQTYGPSPGGNVSF